MAEKENLKAVLMLEILGRPAEHIKKILSEIIDKLGKEENVKITGTKIAEPKPLEEQNLFTSFAEVELETSLQILMALCFTYMPSHVEIISPERLEIKNNELNIFLNELARRLHQYDELAKALMIERQIIAKQVKEGKIKIEGIGEKFEKKAEKKTEQKRGKGRKRKQRKK